MLQDDFSLARDCAPSRSQLDFQLGTKSLPDLSGTIAPTLYWTPPGVSLANSEPTLTTSTPARFSRIFGDHCRDVSHVRQADPTSACSHPWREGVEAGGFTAYAFELLETVRNQGSF